MKTMQRILPLLMLAVAPSSWAQIPPGSTTASASLSGYAQLETDLDQGGQVHMSGMLASGTVLHQFTPHFGAGVTLRYDFESWHFDDPLAFGGKAPWGDVQRPSIAVPMRYALTSDMVASAVPSVQWAYEDGANAGDAVIYGALLSIARVFSPSLMLGLGAAIFREIDETKAFPFVLVEWKIDDRWRVANPFPAGPAGGAGVELVYAPNDAWELAAGGTWRTYRFRLDRDGPVPNGIAESRGVPLFARATYRFTRDTRLDAYAGALLGGKLTVMNSDGNDVARDEFGTAPLLGITLSSRF